ncbi:MAG: exodeoxyribonuclease VII large subunit [Pseudomonadota bacterium]
MDLIDEPAEGQNTPEFSVSELSGAVKRVVEGEFGFVRVRGEVGRVSRPRSGHVYLDLKDDRSVLAGVIWKGVANRLKTQPEEGLEVVATGRLTTFPGQSRYQIVIEDVRPAGVGALMAMLEQRKRVLEAEGLFAPERKRPLPYLPEVVGVITSPSGAVIRDILHRLRDRFPREVLVWPVAVQGDKCAPEVARAIKGFNALGPDGALPRPDVLIVARGGGSIEDLWGFNEEIVVRAAAASEIPLISAVGHETDTTLIDHVADRRAPTPTAAAEIAVPVRLDLLAHLESQGARLSAQAAQSLERRRERLRDLSRGLPRKEALLETPRQRLDAAERTLPAALRAVAQVKRARLAEVASVVRPNLLATRIAGDRATLARLSSRLAPALSRTLRDEKRRTHEGRLQLGQLWERLGAAFDRLVSVRADGLASLDRMRRSLGYEETLGRGYAVVWNGGAVVTTAAEARDASALEIQFKDGRLRPAGGSTARQAPKAKPTPPSQGSLF